MWEVAFGWRPRPMHGFAVQSCLRGLRDMLAQWWRCHASSVVETEVRLEVSLAACSLSRRFFFLTGTRSSCWRSLPRRLWRRSSVIEDADDSGEAADDRVRATPRESGAGERRVVNAVQCPRRTASCRSSGARAARVHVFDSRATLGCTPSASSTSNSHEPPRLDPARIRHLPRLRFGPTQLPHIPTRRRRGPGSTLPSAAAVGTRQTAQPPSTALEITFRRGRLQVGVPFSDSIQAGGGGVCCDGRHGCGCQGPGCSYQ